MRRITEIIIHCSATPEGKDFTVDDIRRWHLARHFADIVITMSSIVTAASTRDVPRT